MGTERKTPFIPDLVKSEPTLPTDRRDIAFTVDTGQGIGQQTPLLLNRFPEKKDRGREVPLIITSFIHCVFKQELRIFSTSEHV